MVRDHAGDRTSGSTGACRYAHAAAPGTDHVNQHRFSEVLEAARAGAEWAWTDLYRDLAPAVLGYLRTRGAIEAEDLLSEVFLQVVRDLHAFEGSEWEFRSWVFVIAHHRMLDDRRRRDRRPVEPTAETGEHEVATANVEMEALVAISTDRVRAVLSDLAPDQRDVLLLRLLGGLTVDDVARVLGKSPGAVKALQRRGLAAIERTLAAEGVPL